MATDWRLALPESRRRHLRIWFASGALLTFVILVVGGITRLTQSGLSIVDWKPIMGVVPPLSETEWVETFARYQAFPEYQKLRQGMSLAEFKLIFFWEYTHRLAARVVGIVFLVPFVYFWARGYFARPLLRRVLVLFLLGAAQGFMGWFMVKSGLVDRPSVSHYRLAAHFSIAVGILGLCSWLAWELRTPRKSARPAAGMERWVYLLGALLGLQILWGAFVAGLDAGLYFNTFPLMGGRLVPPGGFGLEPAIRNLVENPIAVQWVHRVMGTVLLAAALLAAARARRAEVSRESRRASALFAALIAAQYVLGVLTLVFLVPVSLGALHQAAAVVVFLVWLHWLHQLRAARRGPAPSRDGLASPGAADVAALGPEWTTLPPGPRPARRPTVTER